MSDELTWRALRRDDLPAWAELVRAEQRYAGSDELVSAEELAASFDDTMFDPPADSLVAQPPDGRLVAQGVVAMTGPGRELVRVYCWGGVHPDWQGRGLGRRLLGWQLDRGTERYAGLGTDLPGVLETLAPDGYGAARLYARFGLRPARCWAHLAHDLVDVPVAGADGLAVTPYREDLSDRVRRAHNESFTDHWGSAERDPATWRETVVGHPAFCPELSFVVLDGDRADPAVAAYLMSYDGEAADDAGADDAGADVGPGTAYLGLIGTRRAWRKRGLASALVSTALAAARARGYRRVTLTVDADNAAGALGLYQRLGFTTVQRYVTYHRPVGPVSPVSPVMP
ncbi:MAG TPA: GNAT family N-acetyltransferase [Mycobacteriales bacterium]|nr:GNAT family N-acetyltransferase [Mycobacteriales bacterium]